MRALNRFSVVILLASTFANATTAQTKAAESTQSQTGNSTFSGVTTVDQAIDHIVAREHEEVGLIRRYAPIVETYVQEVKPDEEMGIVPARDHYFLGQAELSKGI